MAKEKNFEVKLYKVGAAQEQTRPPRLVRIAVVQNSIVRPTTDPIKDQVHLHLTRNSRISVMSWVCLMLCLCPTDSLSSRAHARYHQSCLSMRH